MFASGKRILFIVYMVLGIIIAVQVRSIWIENQKKDHEKIKNESLIAQINKEKEEISKYKEAISEFEKQKSNYIKSIIDSNSNTYLKEEKQEYDNVSLKAGITDVKGAGVIVRMDDALYKKNTLPSNLVIHDTDIQSIINQLKVSGAQALAINDERIVSMSELICAGPTVRINKRRYSVPYEIKAIGNQDKIYDDLMNSQYIVALQKQGIRIKIDKSKNIIIPGYSYDITKFISNLEEVKKWTKSEEI